MSSASLSIRSDDIDILLVDDSASDAELTLYALRRLVSRKRTLWLNDSQLALEYLLCNGRYECRAFTLPLLVMTDIHMPHVSGLELLTRIRAEPRLRMLPVVVVSACADPDKMRECSRLGADDYVAKIMTYELFAEQVALVARHWLNASI